MKPTKATLVLVKTGNGPLDSAISFFTNTDIRHAAMMFPEIAGEVLFEASGFKGQVLAYRQLSDLKDKKLILLDFEIDNPAGFNWALKKIGTKYDYKGFLLWALNRQVKGKVYCFEYAANIMRFDSKMESYVKTIKDGSISGQDLFKIARDIKKAAPRYVEV